MKRIVLLFLLLCTLCGCSLAPNSYLSVKDHVVASKQPVRQDMVLVQDYNGLKRVILDQVESGQPEGSFWASNYDGSLEDDLIVAAYEVSKLNPLGAYAVEYLSHDCTYIVNHYEVTVRITFRRTPREIAAVENISTTAALRERLERALLNHEDQLVIRMSGYREPDIETMVAEFCAENPAQVLEHPTVTVSVYPDSGTVRILEIGLAYTNTPAELERREQAVLESVDAAAEYIRYRQTDRDKAELLFTYLMERFSYVPGRTATPLYDAVCGGVADPAGMTQGWQMVCDQAGVTCYTVQGLRDGEAYSWNIVGVDGYFRHLDLADCVLEHGQILLLDDTEMQEYYWNKEIYPVCEPYPEPETPDLIPTQPEEAPPADAEPPESPAEEP